MTPCSPSPLTHRLRVYRILIHTGTNQREGERGNSTQSRSKIPTWLTVSPVYKLYKTPENMTFRVWCLHSWFVHRRPGPAYHAAEILTLFYWGHPLGQKLMVRPLINFLTSLFSRWFFSAYKFLVTWNHSAQIRVIYCMIPIHFLLVKDLLGFWSEGEKKMCRKFSKFLLALVSVQ